MSGADGRESVLARLRAWRSGYRRLMAARDPLVVEALARHDISKEDVHQATGLGRTTIDRIADRADKHGPETPED